MGDFPLGGQKDPVPRILGGGPREGHNRLSGPEGWVWEAGTKDTLGRRNCYNPFLMLDTVTCI